MTDVPLTFTRYGRRRPRWGVYAAVGVALVVAAVASVLLARVLLYRHEAMPGVRVWGVDVGGESRKAIERDVGAAVAKRLARPMTVLVGKERITVRPSDLVTVNAHATAAAALRAGQESFGARAQALMSPFGDHHDVEPILQIRRIAATKYLPTLARFGRAPVDAKVRLDGVKPVVTPARAGTTPDGNTFLKAVRDKALAGEHVVRLHFLAAPAKLSTISARVAAAQASAYLSGPIDLRLRGETVGRFEPARLAKLLRLRPAGTRYAVSFDRPALAAAVDPLLARFEQKPVDARFVVDSSGVQIVSSQPGLAADAEANAAAVAEAARSTASRSADLALRTIQPPLTTAKAQALGIRQPIVSYTTQMGASSANRIHNVHLMADYIDGTLIKPGQTFSFNKVVGPRTSARGFLEGQEIIGSLTVPSIGGGVCQTATTLFNDAFEAGFPILARLNHNYYLSHYPLGRDATVSWGGPDLVFRNDLKHGILIKSSYTDSTLTFTFYGTPQGRKVEAQTSPQTDWTNPQTTTAYDPTGQIAGPGQVVTVPGSGERGFDVTVYRIVTQYGIQIRQDSFFSRYVPVGDTRVYGAGTNPPRPYNVIPAAT